MDVLNCPKCASNNIESSSGSAEYANYTTWECEECDWSYKKGTGMGVASTDRGEDPRNLYADNDTTWCNYCETYTMPNHGCHPEEHVGENEIIPKDIVLEKLSEWHRHPEEKLAESIYNGNLSLTPDLNGVLQSNMKNDEVWIDMVTSVVKNKDDDDSRFDHIDSGNVLLEIDGHYSDSGKKMVKYALEEAVRAGRVSRTLYQIN